METIFNQIEMYVNLPYLLTFVFLSYFVKRYLKSILTRWIGKEFKTVFVVLIIAALVAIPYMWFGKIEWQKVLLTYCVGTSLHELFFIWIENRNKPTA